MSQLNRNDIVNFLETCVHRTLTIKDEKFTIILQTLYNCYIGTQKFTKETLDNIEAIKITRTPKKKSLLVQIRFRDTKHFTSISWTNLYKKQEKTEQRKIVSAFRHQIKPQILNYRNSFGCKNKCFLCENESRNELEVDHVPPNTFKNIFDSFINEIDMGDIKVWWSSKHSRYLISDKKLAEEWEIYHEKMAKYRMLCGNCNKKN
jgi:hypothetical protein